MSECTCNKKEICLSILFKFYFSLNLGILIFIIYYYFINPFNDQELQDNMHNWELSPIYEIFLSDEIKDESIKFGNLKEYSNKNINIKSADIYKWRNKSFNVKRLDKQIKDLSKEDYYSLSPKPITNIIINNLNKIYNGNINYTTIKIDDKHYLHYTNNNSLSVIVDLKISHKTPFTFSQEEKNICFMQYCSILENKNTNHTIKIDSDSSNNFIKYNNIEIEEKNSFAFYNPEFFQLYGINNVLEEKTIMSNIIIIKYLYLSFFIITILLRFIKIILFYFITRLYRITFEIKNIKCNCFNFILIIFHIINMMLIIIIYGFHGFSFSAEEKTSSIMAFHNSQVSKNTIIMLIFFEIFNILLIFVFDFEYYFEEWDDLNDYWDSSHVFCPCLLFCIKKRSKRIKNQYDEKLND